MVKTTKIIGPVLGEFRMAKCGFNHNPPEEFVKSQWQKRSRSICYLIYRWIVAIFFVGVLIDSAINSIAGGRYFTYLTNWGVLLYVSTSALGAILVTIWHFHSEYADRIEDTKEMPNAFKVYWGMHNTTLVLSLVITIVYWAILYNEDTPLTATNLLTHAFNSFIMFIDLLIVAYPIRLLHIFMPVTFGISYAIFSVIYYFAGGTDVNGEVFIYSVLDWSRPNNAIKTVVGVLTLCCIIYIVIFMISKLRSLAYRHCMNTNKETLPNPYSTSTITTGISMVFSNYGHENPAFTGSTDKLPS